MPSVTFEDVTPEQLLVLGDTALAMGARQLALAIYQAAAKQRFKEASAPVHSRIGAALAPQRRRQLTLDLLHLLETVDPGTAFVGEGIATWFKSTPFTEDPLFIALAEKHANLLPVAAWHWNLQTVLWAVQSSARLEGDFVELGVFKGHTTAFVAEYLGFQNSPKTWFLYDTFEGIPEDQLDEGWGDNNVAAYSESFDFEEVRTRFATYPNIRIIKGRVPEILAEESPDKIAFLHMDLNNATAEVQALDILSDRIVPGGIIVFDDYVWAVSNRQRVAEDAWGAARGLKILALPTGQGLLIKR